MELHRLTFAVNHRSPLYDANFIGISQGGDELNADAIPGREWRQRLDILSVDLNQALCRPLDDELRILYWSM